MKTLHELFLHHLADMYDAEQQLAQALPQVAQETQDPLMKQRIQEHVQETQQQIRNLEACFQALGEQPKATKCAGIAGLLQEKQMLMRENPSMEVLQAANLADSMKIENYEVSAYTALVGLADLMGHVECERLLKENLQAENAMAKFLEQNTAATLAKLGQMTGEYNQTRVTNSPYGNM